MSSLIKKINEINKNGEARYFVMFGGASLNFTEQQIKNIWRIKIFAMFGGADIYVPDNVNVNVSAFCLFGSVDDKRTATDFEENALIVNIKAFCLFGGVTVKNIKKQG